MAADLLIPVAALGALRAAVLATPDGELRLRDAGFAAGGALYDAFAAHVRAAGDADPVALPLPDFLRALGAFFGARGWGTLETTAEGDAGASASADPDTVRLAAADWAEADAEPAGRAPYPACHFSTGLFAGFLARVAGRPLAVLEVRCRAAGDGRCEFVAGSPAVMDRVWERMMRGEGAPA
jgi:uncharacterized protein